MGGARVEIVYFNAHFFMFLQGQVNAFGERRKHKHKHTNSLSLHLSLTHIQLHFLSSSLSLLHTHTLLTYTHVQALHIWSKSLEKVHV